METQIGGILQESRWFEILEGYGYTIAGIRETYGYMLLPSREGVEAMEQALGNLEVYDLTSIIENHFGVHYDDVFESVNGYVWDLEEAEDDQGDITTFVGVVPLIETYTIETPKLYVIDGVLADDEQVDELQPRCQTIPQTSNIKVRAKQPGEIYYGEGGPMGYVINNERPPEICLLYGLTYKLRFSNPKDGQEHPIYLGEPRFPKGGPEDYRRARITESSSTELEIDTLKLSPGGRYHLLCQFHPWMGIPVLLLTEEL